MLVNVAPEKLRDGETGIYELMVEESVINYWEKYGAVAFDPGQKAVLTSCVLAKGGNPLDTQRCCFSFTLRRDQFNIPFCIVGHFIPIS